MHAILRYKTIKHEKKIAADVYVTSNWTLAQNDLFWCSNFCILIEKTMILLF